MATEEEHLQQFVRNDATSQRLVQSLDFDWGVIALFYASLHLVQAYFVRNGIVVLSHRQRDQQILATADLRSIFEPYVAMRMQSELARYQCRRFSQQEYERIHDGAFRTVVDHLQALKGDA